MTGWPHDFIMNWLDPIGVVIGLIVAVPIFWTWYDVVFGRKKRHEDWFKQARSGTTPDAVLVVDLLAKEEMKPEVVRFLSMKGIEMAGDLVFEINEHGDISPEKIPELVGRLRDALAEISRLAPGQLHLFYGGPSAFAMVMGAELANRGNVHVYQRTHGQYVDWGPVRHVHC